ncbi:signal peptidase II [Sphingomonas sp. R-74633]|uniref:signal peptidase II n=1 Tax=Sphingomonas sp. R-74633 TaxID=2751188 RepID=UPI0015D42DEE|nr:signal peptidase II [Sphingomonas sp. R-74633]NYT43085.1 signal peptidase II [Sphingomonas sp. R-74633]
MTGINARAAGLIAAAAALGVDQLAKWLVAYPLGLRARGVIEVLPVFNLRWEQNFGVSMSFLTADGPLGRWLLVALTGAIALGVGVWLWRNPQRPDAIALGLILGGALGNISDRLRFGYVVDFLDLHFGAWRPFLIFNTADCAISIGVVILLARALLVREGAARAAA